MTDWVKWPEFKDVRLTGKVSGKVEVTFTSGSRASVRTHAHVNDNLEAITFRNRDWLVHASVIRKDDGTWQLGPNEYNYVSDRHSFSVNNTAPKTFRAAILDALVPVVENLATDEVLRDADYASACQELTRLEREHDELTQKLSDVEAQMRPLYAVRDRYRVNNPDRAREMGKTPTARVRKGSRFSPE